MRKLFTKVIPVHIMLVIFSIIILFPLYYMAVTSFKTDLQYLSNRFGLPLKPTLETILFAMREKNFLVLYKNSIILTVGTGILVTAVSSLGAFAFARMQFKGRNFLFYFIISLMALPPIIMIIPLFRFMSKINLINNYLSALIIYTGLEIPFSIYLLKNFFESIPQSLFEAMRIDGCTRFQTFRYLVLPLSKPALATLLIVNATWVWNELLIALIFLQKDSMRTLMAGIAIYKQRYRVSLPMVTSGLLLAAIPMIVAYILFQKWLVRGVIGGALKE